MDATLNIYIPEDRDEAYTLDLVRSVFQIVRHALFGEMCVVTVRWPDRSDNIGAVRWLALKVDEIIPVLLESGVGFVLAESCLDDIIDFDDVTFIGHTGQQVKRSGS